MHARARMAEPCLAMALLLVGCSGGAAQTPTATATPTPTAPPPAALPSQTPAAATFLPFPEPPHQPLPADLGARLQTMLDQAIGDQVPGISATVMVGRQGTWSGVAGEADVGVPLTLDSQFGIASMTKTVIAAEIFKLIEEGQLSLADRVADHLPSGLDFNAGSATIANLLSMKSGLPDTVPPADQLSMHPNRAWPLADVLASVPARRDAPGVVPEYVNTNYILLGLVIEQVTGDRVAAALRAGVLSDDRLQRLVYQPDEKPQGPLAMPYGGRRDRDVFVSGGGYLPTRAVSSWQLGAGAMAADSESYALWAYLLFGGDLVSRDSLSAMMTDYERNHFGMGVFDMGYLEGVAGPGSGGHELGYEATLVALPNHAAVICVLSNSDIDPTTSIMAIAGAVNDYFAPRP